MMIERHGPLLSVPPASRGSSAVVATTTGLAILSLVASAAIATGTAAMAGQRPRDPSLAAGGSVDAAPGSSCKLTRFASGRVKTVTDGRTFVLDDGREIRLAAIEVPPVATTLAREAQRPPADAADTRLDSAGETARRTLAALVAGREVVLKQADATIPPVDRYERFVAFGFVTNGMTEHSLQDALLARGQAQLSAQVEPPACLPGLRASEDAARRASLGLWAAPLYSVRDAEKPADILPRRGRFAVVKGKVVSVRESGGAIYVNFSRRWSEGFSAFIRKRDAARFPAAGLDLKRLKGRRIEVRGFIEQRRGLLMAVDRPEQIAIAESQAPARP